jgi:hypothetical protein
MEMVFFNEIDYWNLNLEFFFKKYDPRQVFIILLLRQVGKKIKCHQNQN